MADIFLSYKSVRKPAAQHLAKILAAYGYSVWFDYDLAAGTSFGRQIEAELKNAKAVVVLWCGLSVGSKWVLEEAHLASELHKIVPVWLERVQLPFGYLQLETLDLSQWNGSPKGEELSKLLREVARLTGKKPKANQRQLDEYMASWLSMGAPRLNKFELLNKPAQELAEDAPRFEGAKKVGRLALTSLSAWLLIGGALTASAGGIAAFGFFAGGAQKTFQDCDYCPEMVVVPPGEFVLGTGQGTEKPMMKVKIERGFAVGKFEVTRYEFGKFVEASGHDSNVTECTPGGSESVPTGWTNPGFHQEEREPVVCVSWDDANAYVRWLNSETKHKTGKEYRLLSEAEWEYVATNGGEQPNAPIIPDDRTICEFANISDRMAVLVGNAADASCSDGSEFTATVGAKWPEGGNSFGVFDLIGNVTEWTADCYSPEYGKQVPQPASKRDCRWRVARGGSWETSEKDQRVKRRALLKPSSGATYFGFRVAREV